MADADVDAAVQAGRLTDVAGVLDARELQSDDADPLLPPWPAAAHMLAHMLKGDLHAARFVFKRLPPPSRAAPGVALALTLLRALWSHDVEAAWSALAAGWPPGAPAALAAALADRVRADAAAAVGALYSRVPVARAATLLGTDEAGVARIAGERGWRIVDGVVETPEPAAVEAAEGGAAPGVETAPALPGEDELKTLAEYVLQLEAGGG